MAAIIFVTLVLIIFFGDLYIKNRVEKYIPVKGSGKNERELLGGRLLLRRHHNRGMVLNAGEKRQPVVAAVSVVLTVVLTVVFFISLGRRGSNLLRTGLSLLLGQTALASDALGHELHSGDTVLSQGTVATRGYLWSDTYSDLPFKIFHGKEFKILNPRHYMAMPSF